MHGFYRLNILRAFTISTLLLVAATAALVIVTNFKDNDRAELFFSSVNHVLLVGSTLVLITSELDLFPRWFGRYFPLVGPESALVTLGLVEMFFTSYLFADRHCLAHETEPPYLDKLLLATGIISGCSGLFNILASFFFRGSKAGRMRTIRRHGTPLPDSEKGSIRSYPGVVEAESPSVLATFKNAFRSRSEPQSTLRPMEISRPYPAHTA